MLIAISHTGSRIRSRRSMKRSKVPVPVSAPPEREIRERKAKQICMGCPVRTECLDYAVSRPEKYGTWGGLNEDERASERRRRMRRANAA